MLCIGQIINNDECDDKDVLREVRAMFTHIGYKHTCSSV